jgi:hypothetical protein
MNDELESVYAMDKSICKVGDFDITRRMIRSLAAQNSATPICVDAMIELFRKRSDRVRVASDDANGPGHYKPSFFMPTMSWGKYSEDANHTDLLTHIPPNTDWKNVHYLYFVDLVDDYWRVIILDFVEENIKCINTKYLALNPASPANHDVSNGSISKVANRLLHACNIIPNATLWPCDQVYSLNVAIPVPPSDSAICMILILYLHILDVPIAFRVHELSLMRKNFAFWLLDSMLPI